MRKVEFKQDYGNELMKIKIISLINTMLESFATHEGEKAVKPHHTIQLITKLQELYNLNEVVIGEMDLSQFVLRQK